MIDVAIHQAQDIRLAVRFPENANMVTLEITNDDGQSPAEITLFGLPEEVTQKLEALADSDTRTRESKG